MKKWLTLAATAALAGALLLAGCGTDSNKTASNAPKVLKVGATQVPHAEILEQVVPTLAKEGIKLEIIPFSDYVQPNIALQDKELDANFYQHVPYLEAFNKDHKTTLVPGAKIHVEPLGLYSSKVKTIADLPEGAKIAIPNDPTNAGRALLLLQANNLLTLKEGVTTNATVQDIVNNPKQIEIIEVEAAQLPRTLEDVTGAVINTNYALQANLNPTKDALIIEGAESPYANVIAVRAGDENREDIKKLEAALTTAAVKEYIQKQYNGSIVAVF